MGLAERKQKQRIGFDPRNLTWSEDKDRFSFKHMTALGWEENSGIGKVAGSASHVAVVRKMDNGGIGIGRMRKEGEELSAGAGQAGAGLEDVLRRLAAKASASPTPTPSVNEQPSPAPSAPASPGPSAVRNKIASRQRHLASKRKATQDPAALAAILGVPVSSLPTPAGSAPTSEAATPVDSAATSTRTSAESTPEPSDGEPKRDTYETISTATVSVSDYFRQKLREKMLARQAASGSSTPALSERTQALMTEETKVKVGAEWEGQKMQFEEVEATVVDLGGESVIEVVQAVKVQEMSSKLDKMDKRKDKAAEVTPEAGPSTSSTADDEKAAKKARKEAKKAAKLVASSSAPSTPADGVAAPLSEKEEKRRRKEEKKAKKAAKEEKSEKKEKKRKRDEDEPEKKRSKSKSS